MRKRIFQLSSTLVFVFVLSACGQKGPLYIPPEPETTDPVTETEQVESDAQNDAQSNDDV